MDLVTNAEVVASWPGFGSIDADEQAALISDASRAIEDYCRRSFGQATVTESYSGGNRGRIWLRNRPVVSVASVTIGGAEYTNADGGDWIVVAETGELVRGSGDCDPQFAPWFPAGTSNITVEYTHGYSTVPGPVKRACILAIRQLADLAKSGTAYVSESIGDYSYNRGSMAPDAIPNAALRLLGPYVHGGVF